MNGTNVRCLIGLITSLAMAACGGGSGSSPPLPPPLSSNANLADLSIVNGDLEQTFDPVQTSYTALVGFLTDGVVVQAQAADSNATLTVVGGIALASGTAIDLLEGDNAVTVQVTAENGNSKTYDLTISRQPGVAFAQQTYLKSSDSEMDDSFGHAIDIDGHTIAVSAFLSDGTQNGFTDSGTVYVFQRNTAGDWIEQAVLSASNARSSDRFGSSLSLQSDLLVVGAVGEDGASIGINGDQNDFSAPDAGAAYVFERDAAGVWIQDAYLKASNTDAGDAFGTDVSLFGNTVVISAAGEASNATGINGAGGDNSAQDSGAAYVFERDDAGTWAQTAYLKASNSGAQDNFGQDIALYDDTLAVGAFGEDSDAVGVGGDQSNDNAESAGAAYVFERDNAGTWSQQAYLKASNAEIGDRFGEFLDLDADRLVVSALFESSSATGVDGDESDNSAAISGAAFVFERDANSVWTQTAYLKASNTDASDRFGRSPVLQNNTLLIGAVFESSDVRGVNGDAANEFAASSGAAYLFRRENGVWTQRLFLKASNTEASDVFGWSMALDGESVVIAAVGEDSSATGQDGDQFDNDSIETGALYIFGGSPSRDADLIGLQLNGVPLEQAFDPELLNYTASAGFLQNSVRVHTQSGDPGAAITINGVLVGGDGVDLALDEGQNVFNVLVIAEDGTTIANYVVTVTRDSISDFAQSAYAKASNTDKVDEFGATVAMSGNTLVVGAPLEDSNAKGVAGNESNNSALNAGAVYVFVRDSAGSWVQQAYLKASNTDTDDRFGSSLAIDGKVLVVGAPNEDSSAREVDGIQSDNSAINSGAAYVFERDDTGIWTQTAYLKASNTDAVDRFGASTSVSANRIAVGAEGESSANASSPNDNSKSESGAVYIFRRNDGGDWMQEAFIKAPNADAVDLFGSQTALFGDTLAVSAASEDSADDGVSRNSSSDNSASDAGAVYVFERRSGIWVPLAYIKASNSEANDLFGISLALDHNTLVVGAIGEDGSIAGINGDDSDNSSIGSGAAYVFRRDRAGDWTQETYIKAANLDTGDRFGRSVAIDGNSIAVAASGEDSSTPGVGGDPDDNNTASAGAAYIFSRDAAGDWSQTAFVKPTTTQTEDHFGWSIALSASLLAVGVVGEDSSATGIGGNEQDDSLNDSGAVYIFE